jgi:hypothetical protein
MVAAFKFLRRDLFNLICIISSIQFVFICSLTKKKEQFFITKRVFPVYSQIHELFNVFDTDGDGIVSKDSFISCLRRNPLLIALFAPCLVHKDSSQGGHRILEIVWQHVFQPFRLHVGLSHIVCQFIPLDGLVLFWRGFQV